MQFFKSLLVGATALVAFVAAQGQLAFTDAPKSPQPGHTYTLKWSGGSPSAATTILLREGASSDLKTVSTITTTATGGSYTWTVPADIASASNYALQISQGSGSPNFWDLGPISGGSASASASASASGATSSASSKVSSISSSLSSVASSLSSKLSSATASSVSAGTTGIPHTRNSTTITRATLSSTKHATSTSSPSSTESSSSSGSSAAAPSQTGGAGAGLKSNAALVLGAVAAMAYLG